MKHYIWTYWTKPIKYPEYNFLYLICLALSIEKAKRFASKITIYTDFRGNEVLKNFGINEETNLLLNQIPDNIIGKMFAYPKMFALKKINEPVIHVDHDLFLGEDFSSVMPECDIVTEFLESSDTEDIHPHGLSFYTDSYKSVYSDLAKHGIDLFGVQKFEDLEELSFDNVKGYTCSFINSNNPDVTKIWAQKSLDLYHTVDVKNFIDPRVNVVFEQALLYYLGQKNNWKLGTLFDRERLPKDNYLHLSGAKFDRSDQVSAYTLAELEKYNPLLAAKFWRKVNILDRKTIRRSSFFEKRNGKIEFKDEYAQNRFFQILMPFLGNVFFNFWEERGNKFLGLKKFICQTFQEFDLCTPPENTNPDEAKPKQLDIETVKFDYFQLSDIIFLDYEKAHNLIVDYLLNSDIDIDLLNHVTKEALFGVSLNDTYNSVMPKENYNNFEENSKQVANDKAIDDLTKVVPDSDEPLPDSIGQVVEMYTSNEPKLVSVIDEFLKAKNLKYIAEEKKIIREEKKDRSQEMGPSLGKMASNFAMAMRDFAQSGFLRVTPEQYAARMEICNKCEFWQAEARMGMGKCLKCGCTGAKQWIATSECPIQKWGKITKEEVEASKEKENVQAQEVQSSVSEQADSSSQEPSP